MVIQSIVLENNHKPFSPRVLYIVYWGAAEPLGQSLVLPAVKRLAEFGARLTLVTFEKPDDLQNREKIQAIRESLAEHDIRWIPLRYHRRPKVSATAFDVAHGVARALLARVRGRFDIVHARTFIGGLIGMAAAPLLRARFIYHNEGFYPDEQVDGGVWRFGSRVHRFARYLEQTMYRRADGIIALSHRARSVIEDLPAVRKRQTPVIVVPSCVDLEHFSPPADVRVPFDDELRLVYIGSIGGRYVFDQIARFVAIAGEEFRSTRFRVLTRTPPAEVDQMLSAEGVPDGDWSVDCVPHSEVSAELAGQHAGLFFLSQGISEHGCSPTKIGEYWAMGLPVVTTPNVSDTDGIIRSERVGVIVGEHSDAEYRRAAAELRELLRDPELSARCRAAAERNYSLEAGCERQWELYESFSRSDSEVIEHQSERLETAADVAEPEKLTTTAPLECT